MSNTVSPTLPRARSKSGKRSRRQTRTIRRLKSLLHRLVDWEEATGGWDSPVWKDARKEIGRPSLLDDLEDSE
jgi:hypothetical protein